MLSIRGQVLPSTPENVVLTAELDDGSIVEGESRRIDAIVQEFLKFARPPKLEPRRGPLGEFVAGVVEATEPVVDHALAVAGLGDLGRAGPTRLGQRRLQLLLAYNVGRIASYGVAGLLLGRPGHEGLIPSTWITSAVGGNSLLANFFSAVVGAFMYFATAATV